MTNPYVGLVLLSEQVRPPTTDSGPRRRTARASGTRAGTRSAMTAAAVVSALVVGFGVGTARAADPALDVAFTALEKAEAAVNASQSGNLPPKAQHQFDSHTSRAVSHIEKAMEQIQAAKDAVDNP
jgi:riboflavin biosynthesis pyrimidine reductase